MSTFTNPPLSMSKTRSRVKTRGHKNVPLINSKSIIPIEKELLKLPVKLQKRQIYEIFEDENGFLPSIEINKKSFILTVNLELYEDNDISGIINNNLYTNETVINCTCVNEIDEGVPYVWLSFQKDGIIKYNIKCAEEKISKIQIHFSTF